MASPKLTPNQQAINNHLKNNGYVTYKPQDFENDIHAKRLLQLYSDKENSPVASINFDLYIINNLHSRVNKKLAFDIYSTIDRDIAMYLFGISNKALAMKIADDYYTMSASSDEDGNIYFDNEVQDKINKWIKYCKKVDFCYKQYEADKDIIYKNPQTKQEYINQWKELLKKPILKGYDAIPFYIDLLEQGYNLNQKTKAKSKYLLSLELPNIETYEITKKNCYYFKSFTQKKQALKSFLASWGSTTRTFLLKNSIKNTKTSSIVGHFN